MNIEFKKPSTVDEYMQLVSQYCALTDVRLKEAESDVGNESPQSIARVLPPLVSIVNIVGYLRGQGGGFAEFRPEGTSVHQRDLYAVEDAMEARLHKLVEYACSTDEGTRAFEAAMAEYYILNRLPMGKRDAFRSAFGAGFAP